MCTISKVIGISEEENRFVCQTRNASVITGVKKQMWLPSIKYLRLSPDTSWELLALHVYTHVRRYIWMYYLKNY